jgi:asparagine synthase (glutamine-hydrolysing)
MSGLYGICATSAHDAVASLERMRNAMQPPPGYAVGNTHCSGGVAAAQLLARCGPGSASAPEADPAASGDVIAWVDGECYNLPQALSSMGWTEQAASPRSLEEWLVYAYQRGRLDALLRHVDGVFSAAIHDQQGRKLLLITDRHGLRPLYRYQRGGTLAWSSRVRALAALPRFDRTVDATSCSCFLDLGYLLGEHTWFEHVRLCRPASVYEYGIDAGRLEQHHYWTWQAITPIACSFEDTVDALFEHFMEAVRQRIDLDRRTGLSLSGGLDSRAILAAATRLHPGHEGYAFSFGVAGCEDIRIAALAASRSAWRFEAFHYGDADDWLAARELMISRTDGLLDLTHMQGGDFQETVSGHADYCMNGFLGDVIAGGSWLPFPPGLPRAAVLRQYFKQHAALADRDPAYVGSQSIEPVLYAGRGRRFTHMGVLNFAHFVPQRLPFFANSMVEWALSVPAAHRRRNRAYATMLQRYFPRLFRDIPWQKTGRPAASEQVDLARLAQSARRRLAGLAGARDTVADADYMDHTRWLRDPATRDRLAALLDTQNSVFADYCPPELYPREFGERSTLATHTPTARTLRQVTVELYFRDIDAVMA